jgi:hypothetical protein
MPAGRISAICAAALASVLVGASAQSQTLLWSARYDLSTQFGQGLGLGPGRPFRVDGSGGVTLAGLASDTQYFLLRYKPNGTLDQVKTRANNATVGLGPNAGLGLHVSQGGGTVHVLVDIVGYWQ